MSHKSRSLERENWVIIWASGEIIQIFVKDHSKVGVRLWRIRENLSLDKGMDSGYMSSFYLPPTSRTLYDKGTTFCPQRSFSAQLPESSSVLKKILVLSDWA